MIAVAADAFHLDPSEVFVHTRRESPVNARHIIMWVMQGWKPAPSWCDMERALGYDHSTIINAVRRIEREVRARTELGHIAARVARAAEAPTAPQSEAGPTPASTTAGLRSVPGEGLVLDLDGGPSNVDAGSPNGGAP